jgi:phytoene synthase
MRVLPPLYRDHSLLAPLPDNARQFSLAIAYQMTEEVIRVYSKSFYLASGFLPEKERAAVRALYGFCRATDNLVDDPQSIQLTDLSTWRHKVTAPPMDPDHAVLVAWADARTVYQVPAVYGDELIEGCEMDLTRSRYETFEELERYCYCVASTVGLMCMHILGVAKGRTFAEAKPYAIKLGVALQLTNILRDVGEDADRGRIYLPREDMERFKVSEDDILQSRPTDQVRALLRFEIERAERLYAEAWPGIGMLARNSRFAVAVASDVYRGILGKIAENGYDVFNQRAHLSKAEKLRRLPRTWLQTSILRTR